MGLLAAYAWSDPEVMAISDDLYLETEGDPFGYYIDGVSGGLDKAPETYGDPIALNKVSGISGSLLWNATTLITEFMKKKR